MFAQQSLQPKLSRRRYASVSYAMQNSTVFKRALNWVSFSDASRIYCQWEWVGAQRSLAGKDFHAVGPATENELSVKCGAVNSFDDRRQSRIFRESWHGLFSNVVELSLNLFCIGVIRGWLTSTPRRRSCRRTWCVWSSVNLSTSKPNGWTWLLTPYVRKSHVKKTFFRTDWSPLRGSSAPLAVLWASERC